MSSTDPILDAVPPAKAPARKCMSAEERAERKKETTRAWRAANPEKVREQHRAWCAENHERRRKQVNAYYAANKEKRRAAAVGSYARNAEKKRNQKRASYAANPEKFKKHNDAYRAKNREKILAQKRTERIANPEKYKDKDLRKKFGITLTDYNTRLTAQGGGCAVCAAPQPKTKKRHHVDHCHSSGKIRGILCNNCNLALGLVKDSPETLRKLIVYLQAHQ